jgi:heat shock protein HtpX
MSDGLGPLLIFCFFWGMGGSFISLLLSRWMAKRFTRAEILDPQNASGDERWLLDTVYRLAEGAGIHTMPEVGIYPSAELNAFATGANKNAAFVAVSEGLLSNMNKGEIEGVLGHEISHVANGDMVTMSLVQGVVNAFVEFITIILSNVLLNALRGNRDERRSSMSGFFMTMMLRNLLYGLIFSVAGILVIYPFSRFREFRADAGGAERVGKQKMIGALQALKRYQENREAQAAAAQAASAAPALATFKITGRPALFSTHPSLDERIARLEAA